MHDPVQILRWFVQRWQVKVTFREVRDHLGVEMQRLCDPAGKQLMPFARRATATSAWYRKQRPTFADTLAAVRRNIWQERGLGTSSRTICMTKLRPAIRNAITYALCHAA